MRIVSIFGFLGIACLLNCACSDSGDDSETPPGQLAVALHARPSEGVAPLTVDFSSTVMGAEGGLYYAWTFEDGGDASSESSPSHEFTSAGVFPVLLAVEDEEGARGLGVVEVVVHADSEPAPTVSAAPRQGSAPLAVQFACEVSGGNPPLSYHWDFGDGEGLNAANPWHSYTASGQYTATCTVSDADGDSSQGSLDIQVLPANGAPEPAVAVIEGACSIPGRTRVQVDASASSDPEDDLLSFEWVFVRLPPDSQARFNQSGIANPTFVPDANGIYEMRVFVSDGEHRRASEVLAIEASDEAGVLQLIAGDGQVGVAGTPMTESLQLAATNTCGSPLPHAELSWSGTNVRVAESLTLTDEYGYGMNSASFGTREGPGSVSVEAGSESLVFSFDVEAGEAAYVFMDRVEPATVDEPATIHLQVTDFHLNPLDSPDLNIDLFLVAEGEVPPGQEPSFLDTGTDALLDVPMTGGHFSTQVQSFWAGPVRVEMEPQPLADGTQLESMGRLLLFGDDMESWVRWEAGEDSQWELGVPGVGPAAAHSGTRVLGTRLDAPFAVTDQDSIKLRDTFIQWPGLPLLAVSLEFWQWYDFGGDERPCSPGVGVVFGGADPILAPPGGYPGPATCGETDQGEHASGYGGVSEGWQRVALDVSEVLVGPNKAPGKEVGLGFALLAPDYPNAQSGPGWFIDDVLLTGLSGAGRISFVAGAPEGIRAEVLREGVASVSGQCAVEALLGLTPVDQYGNPVLRHDLFVEFSPGPGMELVQVAGGEVDSESAGTYSLRMTRAQVTGEEPALLLSLRSDTPGEIQSTAVLAGVPASSTAIPVNFTVPPPGDCCVNAIPVVWDSELGGGFAIIPQVCDLHANEETQACASASYTDMAFAFQVPWDGRWFVDLWDTHVWSDWSIEVWRLGGEGVCPGEPVASEAGVLCRENYWFGQLHSGEFYVLVAQNIDGVCGEVYFNYYPDSG